MNRILVEDEEPILNLIRIRLKEAGYKCIGTTTVHEAIDLVDHNHFDLALTDYQLLDKKREETKEQKWLMNHCIEYRFILRYPISKRSYTHVNYEPWHYRYVGKDAALEIMNEEIIVLEKKGLPAGN